ncbi:MAG: PAS domain-containing protein [Flavisolibacter sp.]
MPDRKAVKPNMKNRPSNSLLDTELSFSNEEALNIILDNLDEVFFLVDRSLRIIHTTEQTKENVSKTYGIEITDHTCILEMIPPERRPFMLELYEDVFKGIERKTITEVKKDGRQATFETVFKSAKNGKGEIVGAVVIAKDITNQKKAEDILKQTEERWRFALEGGNQGVWDWNVQTGDIFFSDSYKKLYGYGHGDLKGRIEEWERMIHPEDRAKMNLALADHLGKSDPYHESIYRVRSKDGNYKWILGRGMLIRNEAGTPSRMIGTHTDITRQVAAEETYKVLFYSNPLPMWTYDVESLKILAVNDAAINHYGYSKEEFLSMTIKDIRPNEDVKGLEEWVAKRKDLGRITRLSRHLTKSGEMITVELTTHKLDDSSTVLVVANDITSRIMAEEKLRKSNERFLLASRASSDAIYDYDLETNEIYWGEGLQSLFGFDPREVSIGLWEQLIHPEDRERIMKSVRSAVVDPEKEFWKEDYRFTKSDGSYSYVFDRGFIMRNADGKAVRMIGSMQDITERKYAEEILSLERSVFELSNKPGVDFKQLAQTLLCGLEEIHSSAYTSLFLMREDETIELFVTPRLDEYARQFNGHKIGPGDGSCGAAVWTKETVIVEDINTHPLWEGSKSYALQFGLQSAWSLPIVLSSGKVMGTFAVYHKRPKAPSQEELNTFERIRNILRILMEHHWSLDEIRKVNERFDIVLKATHDLIWDWNMETNIIYHDELGRQQVFGVSDGASISTIDKWLTRIHPEDLDMVQTVLKGVFQDGSENIFEMEYRFQKDDGSFSYVYDRGMIIRDEQGKVTRVIGAAQNITERKNLEEELLKNELEKQKAINQATVDSQEQERTEIGKELHDNVNQILTTTKLYLDLALSNGELKDDLITKSTKNILSVINEIRQLSRSLMDPTIGDLGLIDSMNDLIESINLTKRLHVTLEADRKLEFVLSKNQQLTIFRILQEALNNVIKHARASKVMVRFNLKGRKAELCIEDNGIGFDPSAVRMGAGLKNIHNRVYLINGTHRIVSEPKQGSKMIINFPINK